MPVGNKAQGEDFFDREREPDPDLRACRLDTALLKLEEDGYLGNQDQRFLFLSFPLRDYWKRNHA